MLAKSVGFTISPEHHNGVVPLVTGNQQIKVKFDRNKILNKTMIENIKEDTNT
jgi:hypothetical protein